MTPSLAAAIRVLASFDRLEWRAGLGGVRPVRADGTMGPLRSIHVLQLQGLVNRGLVEVEHLDVGGAEGVVKEYPILFSGPLVRAILDGRKDVTRRLVRLTNAGHVKEPGGNRRWHPGDPEARKASPFGLPGDHLWVRETFYVDTFPSGRLPKEPSPEERESLYYRADGECCELIPECQCADAGPVRWRPPIHMPRWASRILLEVTGVRVERLHDITTEDIIREGACIPVTSLDCPAGKVRPLLRLTGKHPPTDYLDVAKVRAGDLTESDFLRAEFASLWDGINGKRPGASWAENPWVWRIEFRSVESNG